MAQPAALAEGAVEVEPSLQADELPKSEAHVPVEVGPLAQADELPKSEAHAPVDPTITFDLQIASLSGETMTVEELHPNDALQVLRERVAQTLGVARGVVKLAVGSQVFGCTCFGKSLQSLGIGPGVTLTLFKQRVLEVTEGLRIDVIGAGTDRVNGSYTCVEQERRLASNLASNDGVVQARVVTPGGNTVAALYFQKDGCSEALSWYGAQKGSKWPAAWFMQTKNDNHGIYYLPSDEPDVLPLDCWEIYNAEIWSQPGVDPMPSIDLAGISSPRRDPQS